MPRPPRVLCIVGSSPERWDDYEEFKSLGVPHDVCCINQAGIGFPGDFDVWYSYHSTELREWAKERPDVTATLMTIGKNQDGVKWWKMHEKRGSSSMQAVRVAKRWLGYDKVVLCGVALSEPYRRRFFRHWAESYGELIHYVRSMSGATKDLFGPPTIGWLGGHDDDC